MEGKNKVRSKGKIRAKKRGLWQRLLDWLKRGQNSGVHCPS